MSRSHIKKKPMRNSAMEALGFIERPSVSYVEGPSVARSELVSTTAQTGLTVAEMWDTTELHADSMVDWQPVDVDERHLNKKIRWPMLLLSLLLVAGLTAGGYYMYQAPASGAQAALAVVVSDGGALGAALNPLETVTEKLTPGQNVDSAAIGSAAADVDDASRELFSSAGELPASESSSRSAATEAATQALDASNNLTGLATYVGAITPVMVAPTLITDPELVDLQTAVSDFGQWRNEFDTVRLSLPEGTMTLVTQELALVSNRLEQIQNAYVDGLRDDDQQAALAAVRDLEGHLSTAWSVLLREADAVKVEVTTRIEAAWNALNLLPG